MFLKKTSMFLVNHRDVFKKDRDDFIRPSGRFEGINSLCRVSCKLPGGKRPATW